MHSIEELQKQLDVALARGDFYEEANKRLLNLVEQYRRLADDIANELDFVKKQRDNLLDELKMKLNK